ncbi:MAG TPA: aspartate-semialdehyde dehydrogenase, partial [Thermoplasmata archaeon]|nr:aspartate-semialdehyde dehydrogenase [Thermoplasmata archaeon]
MTERPFRSAIVGASGYIGQQFARLLATHPAFGEPALIASDRSVGRRLGDVWALDEPVPQSLAHCRLRAATPRTLAGEGIELVFSALPGGRAGPIESELSRRGVAVFSNAADHRRDPGVPLLVPEVNPDHLRLLDHRPAGHAPIVTNPNCTATGLAVALAPVWEPLRPIAVHVSTYQARSGAGLTGLESPALAENVVPFIEGEEEKVAWETSTLLGLRRSRRVVRPKPPIVVQAARVDVRDGHLEAVTVVAEGRPSRGRLLTQWRSFDPLARLPLPTAPHPPVVVRPEEDRPQPKVDVWSGAP